MGDAAEHELDGVDGLIDHDVPHVQWPVAVSVAVSSGCPVGLGLVVDDLDVLAVHVSSDALKRAG